MIAAKTTLPVIGVPMQTKSVGGLDSLLSIVQMPGGVPVATMASGKAVAVNAALFAAQILAVIDDTIAAKLSERKESMRQAVLRSSKELQDGQ